MAIFVGRPYGSSALSQKFIKLVQTSESCFKELLKDWLKLVEKFQVQLENAPPGKMYHQAMMVVKPEYAGKGVGTQLAGFVMKTIQEEGFVGLVRETVPRVVDPLQAKQIIVIDIYPVSNSVTNLPLIFRIQLFKNMERKTEEVIRLSEHSHLMTGNHSLRTNDDAKRLFLTLEQLEELKKRAIKLETQQEIQQRIDKLESIIKSQLDGPDSMGGTPVQGASHAKNVETLRKLIRRGADLSIPEPFYGGTVLHVAVDGGSLDCVKEILQYAPQLTKKANRSGVTALAWAKTLDQSRVGYEEIISTIKKEP